jgi:hypothetical protein
MANGTLAPLVVALTAAGQAAHKADGRWPVALWRSAVVRRLPKDRRPTRAVKVRPYACRAVGSVRVETCQKAHALGIKPRFQSFPKTAHSTSREFGK